MTTPHIYINADVPRKHDDFDARTTTLRGRTFHAQAVEFNDHGEPVERIMVNIHHDGYFPEGGDVSTCIVNGQVVIDLADLSIYVPVGREDDLISALMVGLAERDRQVAADENTCVTGITGDGLPARYTVDA